MNELQALVDALAVELGRPVGVDDRRFNALAYSSHEGAVDSVRRDSILRRRAPPPVTDWLRSLGVETARAHVRVPASEALGMEARVCVPVRFEGDLLAYLWLIDEPPLDAAALQLAERYGEDIAVEVVRARRLDGIREDRATAALERLLADSPDAAADLTDDGGLVRAGGYAVAVARLAVEPEPGGARGEAAGEVARTQLRLAAEEVRRSAPPHHVVTLARGDEAVIALAFDDPAEPRRRAGALLGAARAHLVGTSVTALVGLGAPRSTVVELAAAGREAALAAAVAQAIPELGEEPVAWEGLGAYRTLVALLGDRAPAALVPAPVGRLRDERDGDALIETAEVFLDAAGDARAAAERLFLHRSSLYKRLRRIERITGYDLRRGDDRLELHLGLRLRRLAGAAVGRRPSPPPG